MTQPEPIWLLFGDTAQISLRRMPDGTTVYFEVITTGEGVNTLVMAGNAHIDTCNLSVSADGLCFLGLGLCTVPVVNDGATAQWVAAHLGIPPPVLNPAFSGSPQRLLA